MHVTFLHPVLFLWITVVVCIIVQASLQNDTFEICYDESHCSPPNWPGICQYGEQQSPINLEYHILAFQYSNFSALKYNTKEPKALIHSNRYFEVQSFILTNNGYTAKLSLNNDLTSTTYMSGSLVGGHYTFSQLHFHWGDTVGHGSEHTFNNIRYAMEVHFVHYKSEMGSFAAALSSNTQGAVTVVALLFQVMDFDNPALDPIIEGMEKVQNASTKTTGVDVKLSDFFWYSNSTIFSFVRYHGSLTTPPCTEKVNWIISADTIQISLRQLKDITSLLSTNKNRQLEFNNRNIQNDDNTAKYNVEYMKSSIWKG